MMLAVLIGSVAILATLIVLAASGFGGAATSTAVTSTGSTFTSLLPYVGAILGTGLVLAALGNRR